MNQIDQLSKNNKSDELKKVQEDMLKDLYAMRENLCSGLDQACEKANQGQQNNTQSDEVKQLESENKKLNYRIQHLLWACDELEGKSKAEPAKHAQSAAPKFELITVLPNLPQAQLVQVVADFSGVNLNVRMATEEEQNDKEF